MRRFSHTMMTAAMENKIVSQGWASGHSGLFIWKWYTTAIRRLPRALLNKGARMTEMATTPAKKAGNDQALCAVPLSRKAGMCQAAQMIPRIRPAQNGLNLRCNRGRATPRHPNSSIGPRNKASPIAGSTRYQGEKGNGSLIVPFNAAPAKKITGMPRIRYNHHNLEARHRVSRRKKLPKPLEP